MKRIGVLTVGRSDYTIVLPILRQLKADPFFETFIFGTSAHFLSSEDRPCELESDGFHLSANLSARSELGLSNSFPKSMSDLLLNFSAVFERFFPEILLVTGDRWEVLVACLAASAQGIPVAHVHGGEKSEGSLDETYRHAITKLSHIHFVSHREAARRVIQLGEAAERVHCVGAPALDLIGQERLPEESEFKERLGLARDQPFLLVTFHPETANPAGTLPTLESLLQALIHWPHGILFTRSNSDLGGDAIDQRIEAFVKAGPHRILRGALGRLGYWGAMRWASAMLGNSSSGIIEAASFRLPVVNVGERQSGRYHAKNVLHARGDAIEILETLQLALSPRFREMILELQNPYGTGGAAIAIAKELKKLGDRGSLLVKRFGDI